MKIENDDDRLILIAVFRYALGRMTTCRPWWPVSWRNAGPT